MSDYSEHGEPSVGGDEPEESEAPYCCDQCTSRLEELARSAAYIEAEWTCPDCGDVKFKKSADPQDGIREPVRSIVFYLCAAAAVVAVVAVLK